MKSSDIVKSNKLVYFFNVAKDLSLSSEYKKYKFGAVVVLRGKIISMGVNSNKTHPLQKKFNQNRNEFHEFTHHPIHAEISTLNKIKHMDLKKAQMFIYHNGPTNNPKVARPCAACMCAIKKNKIKTIHYSTDNGFITEKI